MKRILNEYINIITPKTHIGKTIGRYDVQYFGLMTSTRYFLCKYRQTHHAVSGTDTSRGILF